MVSGPGLFFDREQMTEIGPRTAQPGLKPAQRFFLAQVMRDSHDKWLRHDGSQGDHRGYSDKMAAIKSPAKT
jgi:hypothetical protein